MNGQHYWPEIEMPDVNRIATQNEPPMRQNTICRDKSPA